MQEKEKIVFTYKGVAKGEVIYTCIKMGGAVYVRVSLRDCISVNLCAKAKALRKEKRPRLFKIQCSLSFLSFFFRFIGCGR